MDPIEAFERARHALLLTRSGFARAVTLAATVLLYGCTPTTETQRADAGAEVSRGACARFGQTCEFAPGKLGTCVQRTECTGDDCFVCQSQH
jgi:hypothetical protein